MKKNKIGLILITVLLVACVALIATACNGGNSGNKGDTYEMSFVVEGETIPSIVSAPGRDITPPTAPEKEGMKFVGWFLNNEGEAVSLPNIMPAQNRVYYARYVAVYTISFVVEGETIPSITGEAGMAITPPIAPEKKDMIFLGWFLNNTGVSVQLPTVMPAENLVFYAKYRAVGGGTVTVPEDYMFKYDQIGADNHLYLDYDATTVYIEYNNTVIKSELSPDERYVEFSVGANDYCAVLDVKNLKYNVYEYGYSKDTYLLYLPLDDSFNRERGLVFGDNSTFSIVGDYYGTDWASGTYTVVNPVTQEYNLKVTKDYTFGLFTSCKVRLTKRIRQSSEIGTYIYNAFNIYDANIDGNFTNSDGETLTLDGYGYATYTDKNGNTTNGMCEETAITGFADKFINFINASTKEYSIFILGNSVFMPVGNEIGLYREYDVLERHAGSYYFLIDGLGTIYVFYGKDAAYNPETEVALATYEILEDGAIKYIFSELIDGNTVDELYAGTFNFKFTTYGSGMYETDAFAIYNPEIAGTWAAENGASTIVLDGYGNATHNDSGSTFSGAMQIDTELKLFLITDADENQRIFRFNDDNGQITYRQIGLEIGTYDLYSYANGFDYSVVIYLDGENHIDYYVYNTTAEKYEVQQYGTYQKTENEDEYEVEFTNGNNIKIAIRQLNFGTITTPNWQILFVIYDENSAGTYTGKDGATLTLDGYGFSATFIDSDRWVYEGEFAKEWNVVTLLSYDEEGEASVFVFRLTGSTFVLNAPTSEAGVYYNYSLNNDFATDSTRLILGGDGTAYYLHYDDIPSNAVGREATYSASFDALKDRYVYTLIFNDDHTEMIFALDNELISVPVFIEYDENWEGTFTDEDGICLVLDGFGKAIYRNDYYEIVYCTVFGNNYDAVTFNYGGIRRTLVLDRNNDSFEETDEPIGIYYPYQEGTISGRKRMIISTNGKVELQTFSEDKMCYEFADGGTYTEKDKLYRFVSANGGEGFSFKIATIGGYEVYRTYDGYDTTPLLGSMKLDNGTTVTTRLTLDGYGSATYNFFHTDDGKARVQTGYYYYSEEYECLIFVATNEYDEEYWKYYIKVDFENHTFKIIDESSPFV